MFSTVFLDTPQFLFNNESPKSIDMISSTGNQPKSYHLDLERSSHSTL